MQICLAEKLESSNMVNFYVKNRQRPNIKNLCKIAEILGPEAKDLSLDAKGKK